MQKITDYLWILPAFLAITIFILFPLCRTLWLSFQYKVPGGEAYFVGFKNYLDSIMRGDFFSALMKTLIFTIPAIVLKFFIGMVAAVILNNNFFGRNVIRSWFFIPWAIPSFCTAILFVYIFGMNRGINLILSKVGVNPVFWLGPQLAMASIIMVNVWKGFPFFMLGILAGLQSIPASLYEASKIDGASGLQQFFFVTLPSLKNIVLIITVLSTIWTFSEFTTIFIMTGGGPAKATMTLSQTIYATTFQRMQMPRAAATSVMTLPILLLLITWLVKLIRSENE